MSSLSKNLTTSALYEGFKSLALRFGEDPEGDGFRLAEAKTKEFGDVDIFLDPDLSLRVVIHSDSSKSEKDVLECDSSGNPLEGAPPSLEASDVLLAAQRYFSGEQRFSPSHAEFPQLSIPKPPAFILEGPSEFFPPDGEEEIEILFGEADWVNVRPPKVYTLPVQAGDIVGVIFSPEYEGAIAFKIPCFGRRDWDGVSEFKKLLGAVLPREVGNSDQLRLFLAGLESEPALGGHALSAREAVVQALQKLGVQENQFCVKWADAPGMARTLFIFTENQTVGYREIDPTEEP